MQGAVQQPLYKRRWFIVLAACLVLVAAVLTVLPYGMSYALNTWLRDNGGDEVTIQDVDFNVFTGRAAIENLRLSADQRELMTIPRLELDVDWLPLFSRQVVLRSASIMGVDLEIEQAADGSLLVGGISLAGEETKEPVPAGKTWHVGVDSLAIESTSIRYRSPALQLDSRLDDLRLRGIKTWVDEPAPLTLRGAINGAAISIDGELPPLSSGAGYRGRIDIDGLDLATFAGLTGEAISELAGRLHVASRVDILQAQDKPLTVSQSGTLAVSELAFRQPDAHIQLGRIGWDGKIGFTGGDALDVAATGGVQGTGVRLDVAGSQAALGEIAWDGEVNVAGGDEPVVTGTYKVVASQVDVDRQGSAARLAHVDAISIDSVTLQEGGIIDIAMFAAEGIALARTAADGDGAIVTLGGLALDSAQVAGGGVALGRLSARDLVADLRRDSAGQWRITQVMDSLESADTPSADESSESGESDKAGGEGAEAAAGKESTAFSIDAISVTGNSAVTLSDASVEPAFDTRMEITRAEIGRIDSASPGADTPLTLEAKTGKHSRIDIKGTLQPFATRPTLRLDSRLEAIALINVSPYTIATLGYALKSGQLDADSTINIDQGKLDIGNKLTIRGLEVEAVDNASREQLDQQMSVPLDTALNMLRDKHNTIKLDLPVSGDIDSPDFDISDAVNTAVGKALKKGSMTYLTMALQPYGALISVAKMAGEAASKVRLDPVVFTPGGETLPATTHAYLEKVAGIINNRPELNIKVCGLASEQDRQTLGGPVYASQTAGGRLPATILDAPPAATPDAPAPDSGSTSAPGSPGPAATGAAGTVAPGVTDEQLQALADKRAAAVIDYLVTAHGVKASRLVACQPAIDAASDAQARVDLLI